ncbi:hypothetical protein NLB25_27755, partial [Klebsiella pneumoniae]|nr:hypothetical protein [Klebsiella pneumoniae]
RSLIALAMLRCRRQRWCSARREARRGRKWGMAVSKTVSASKIQPQPDSPGHVEMSAPALVFRQA